MVRCIDPMRRALPVLEWPRQDQAAWTAARTSFDVLEDGGLTAHWAPKTTLTNIQHYGRWLGYLRWRRCLDEEMVPAARVTREQVGNYHRHLEQIVAPYTRLSMLVGLKVMMQAMAPERSWDWLQKICNRIQMTAKPTSNKRSRMRPTAKIFGAAIRELKNLPPDPLSMTQALRYRDALMLAFLASRPVRVKNFTTIELDRHLLKVEDNWLLTVPAEETKTKQPIAFLLPEVLLPWFERYLVAVRPRFPDAEVSARLWLGKNGVQTDPNMTWLRITKLTQRLFGRAINPHLLRDCAASSLAASSSDLARAAAPLLGHRHFSTTERYYIQADNLEASRRFNSILGRVKSSVENVE